MHRDEGFVDVHGELYDGEHAHAVYMPWTEDGRLCAKEIHGPKLWKKLNREYPAFMHERGFDVNDSLVLDYDEVERIDDAIKQAESQEEVDALEAEKQALKDAARKEKQRRREARQGLPHGVPARNYRRHAESQMRLAVAEQEYSIAVKAALDAEIDKEVLVESMEQNLKELNSQYEVIEDLFHNAVDMRKEADEARLKAYAERNDAIAERDAAIAERDKALREQLDKLAVLAGIEAEISMKRKSADKDLDTYKAKQYEKIDSDIAAEKQRRIEEAVGAERTALAARERSLAEDEEELEGREKAVSERAAALDAKQASLDQRKETRRNHMHKEYVKAMGAAADAEKLVGQLNGLMDTYESAIEAAEKRALPKDVDDVVWQLKRIKPSEKSLERYPNAKNLFDVYLGMAQGSGGRAFQECHDEFVHSRGTVNDAEARVQEIIKHAADGKKSRGYEVGE